jgi:large-conductance mechanosensitive channel
MLERILFILQDFGKFLKSRNIINTGVAFVIAIQVNKIFLDIIDIIVNPIASKVINQELHKQETKILDINFKTGLLFLSILNFIIILIFIYNVLKLSETAPTLFETIYSNVTNSISNIGSSIKNVGENIGASIKKVI